MKITRGNYPGASRRAEFDRPLDSMTRQELLRLLQGILHRAAPGEARAELVYEELTAAEENTFHQ